ncbi:hypothetical protein C9374_004983 [Naegleria lovaniensis]|uniref:Uncharacterized protein n=1 Tax=Naegleria lovaniensis TaxID=51637 RepID=A0AA88KNV9_NAELO|nr:uncharacterized protein C9374_004983 [Naegleria lovaniensis]KAG2383016.1 hypothetical protein C9374_004983 [Naegleria lovaniensis]
MSANIREQVTKQITESENEQAFLPSDLKGKGELQSDNPYEQLVHGAEFAEEDEEDTDYISGDIAEEKAEDARDQIIPSDDEDEEFDLKQQKKDEGGGDDEFEEPEEEEFDEGADEDQEEVELEEEEDTYELYTDLTKPVSQVCQELANKASNESGGGAQTLLLGSTESPTPPSSTVLTPPTDPTLMHAQLHANFIVKQGEEDKEAHTDTASPQLLHKRKIGTDEEHRSAHDDPTKKIKLD